MYYDKTDLPLRLRLAQFSLDAEINTKFATVLDVLNSNAPAQHESFCGWLSQVSFRLVPKSLVPPAVSEETSRFVSNRTTESTTTVKKVNYFFDGPIELHIICVVWIMFEGFKLDESLGVECYGGRLENGVGDTNDNSPKLYKRYHDLYKAWRDSGIKKAQQMLSDESANVCILGLDIREYYYHVNLDYQELARELFSAAVPAREAHKNLAAEPVHPSKLLQCIKSIHATFSKSVNFALSISHGVKVADYEGLPIGLISSPLLANWYLKKFDEAIFSEVRPAFYGRYIDDIFIVVRAPKIIDERSPVSSFIEGLLVKTGILEVREEDTYEILPRSGLFLQGSKCVLQHFDAEYSTAGLDMFKKRLEQNSSDFKLLPLEEFESSLEHVAYELLYDGSVNKLRSVRGVAENKYELAKYLAKHSTLNLLTDIQVDPLVAKALITFFKGRNAIEFSDLWERVLSFFVVSQDVRGLHTFHKAILDEIPKVSHENLVITMLLQGWLYQHLELSSALAKSLQKMSIDNINASAEAFRNSNFLRHHLVRESLLNFTDYRGDLTSIAKQGCCKVDLSKVENSPRSISFDECMLLYASGVLRERPLCPAKERELFEKASELYLKANRYPIKGVQWVSSGGVRGN